MPHESTPSRPVAEPPTARSTVLKTLLVSDLVDSTRLVRELGDHRAAAIFRRHDRLARDLLEEHGGREIDKTDGFLLFFERPIDAVQFALAYTDSLAALSGEVGVDLATRVGIHLGEVVLRTNKPEDIARGAKPLEVEGLAKPTAARLMSLAQGRQVLLTRGAFDLARRGEVGLASAGPRLGWVAHGPYQFKGVEEPVDVFEVGVEGLAPLKPPDDSEKARRVGSGVSTILVLPFANVPPDSENEYFADGLADEIITDLSKIDSLGVISQTSARQLKSTSKDIRTIGRELDVQYILEGSVRKFGNNIRVTVKLVDAKVDELLWADKYKGNMEDVFEIQESISRSVVSALELTLSEKEEKGLTERPIPDVEAYEYYLRARQEIFRYTEDALERALQYLHKGLEISGDNVMLISAMGYVYFQYVNAGITGDQGYIERVEECAAKIFELEPNSPHGHRLLGLAGMHGGSMREVIKHLKLVLADNSNDTDALFWLPIMYGFVGNSPAAFPLIDRLLKIDPLSPLHHVLPGWLAVMAGAFDHAPQPLWKAHMMDPVNPLIRFIYGQSLAFNGQLDEAFEIFEALLSEMPDNFFAKLGLFMRLALQGKKEETLLAATEELQEAAAADLQYSWTIAEGFALIGENKAAIKWLRKAVDQSFLNYPLLSQLDPFLRNLHEEEGFGQLMDEVRQKWEAFEA